MADAAPVSSGHVRAMLTKHLDISERVINRMEITTRVNRVDRAETTIERSASGIALIGDPTAFDNMVIAALKHLPGFGGGVQISMGRTYTVEWTGICQPI
jgi:hypothetical protein